MTLRPSFPERVFFWAGIYGIAVLLPQYLLEDRLARDFPPPLTHPEYFYGFIGVALAWQLAFLVISRDVVRFRPLMLPAAAEKFLFAASTLVLYAGGRVALPTLAAATIDLALGGLFVASYFSATSHKA
jgi:hypothetical protein